MGIKWDENAVKTVRKVWIGAADIGSAIICYNMIKPMLPKRFKALGAFGGLMMAGVVEQHVVRYAGKAFDRAEEWAHDIIDRIEIRKEEDSNEE